MISLEQVNLLEVKVANAIDCVKQVKEENAALISEKAAFDAEKKALAAEKAALAAEKKALTSQKDELVAANKALAAEKNELAAANKALAAEKDALMQKLGANQKRIEELEVHVMRFKEDQGRIEDGIIAALDRLSQFEEAFESSLKDEKTSGKRIASKPREAAQETAKKEDSSNSEVFFEIPHHETSQSGTAARSGKEASPKGEDPSSPGELDIF